jgi:hypothetical protein
MAHSKEKRHAERGTLGQEQQPQHQTAAPSREQIERLAYAIWEARHGNGPGPEEDWFEAERRLRGEGLAGAGRNQDSHAAATVN